jgi:MerR family transcriptional regulator, thiopeptide resistance regulator
MSEYKVGEVTRLSNVSARLLHHYDEIGLLVPSARTDAGYRLYSADDLERLRQILFYRELDFGLDEIGEILADPNAGTDEHLRRQHRLLRARLARTKVLLNAIEHEMEARKMGISLTPEEQLEVFGTDKFGELHKEAEERFGHTDTWKESQRRAATYTKDDWIAIKREADEGIAGFAEALKAGEPATGQRAIDLAEAHRQYISKWFYECDLERHRNLAELYVSDPRYISTYDTIAPGLAHYVRDAILANAERTHA